MTESFEQPLSPMNMKDVLGRYGAIPGRVELFEFAQEAVLADEHLATEWHDSLSAQKAWLEGEFTDEETGVPSRTYPDTIVRLYALIQIVVREGYVTKENALDMRQTAESLTHDVWHPQE